MTRGNPNLQERILQALLSGEGRRIFTDILLMVKSDKHHIYHVTELASHATNTGMCLYINQKAYRHTTSGPVLCVQTV